MTSSSSGSGFWPSLVVANGTRTYSTSPLRLDCILHSAHGDGPFLDPVRIVVTPEIEVGTTFITVHVVQAKIDIIKLLIAVPAVIKHRRVIT